MKHRGRSRKRAASISGTGNADFQCDLSQRATPFLHAWEHTVGSGHAPLCLRADWQQQITRCQKELGFKYVRFHALLSDEMGTLVREEGKLLYCFFNADQIFDFLRSINMRPFVELSFMPKAIASGGTAVFSYEANVTPPKDYREWGILIRKLATHWVERYGAGEVREWYFEVWNEPNLEAFWTGKQADYFKLYRVTVEALKSVDPLLRVGGPATAKNAWIPDFLDFCARHKLPVDFVSTHHYPTDAFGKPGADTRSQLKHAPPNVMFEDAKRVKEQARGLPVHYTEWNISSNPRDSLHDEPFAAAYATKIILENTGLSQSYSFWTFSDIFNENYFPAVPFQGGFGLLNLHNIAKPVYRAFELLHRLGNEQLRVEGEHNTVSAWAFRKDQALTMILTNHAMPGKSIRTCEIDLRFLGGSRPRRCYIERFDETHANPRALWESMGKPTYLDRVEVEQLKGASELVKDEQRSQWKAGATELTVKMRPHSVAALTLEFA